MERTSPVRQLDLGAGGRIVLGAEPLFGWSDAGQGAPHPLTFPPRLLEATPTSTIVYCCNLPGQATPAPLDFCGPLPAPISRDLESEFIAASFPGGQTVVHTADGERLSVQFRWICLTAHVSIGAVWRCFARLRSQRPGGFWGAVEHDYLFEAGGWAAVKTPGAARVSLGPALDIDLYHPEGGLTCFPCQSGRVKVSRLESDGWAKRNLLSLSLHSDSRVVALFSDGSRKTIATAAPRLSRGSRAA
jgi:hypothetical protein